MKLIILFFCLLLQLELAAQDKFTVNQSTTKFRDLQTKEWGKTTISKPSGSYIIYDKSNLTITIGTSKSENIYEIIENNALGTNEILNVKAAQNLHDNNSSVNEYLLIVGLKVEKVYKIFVRRFVNIWGLTDSKYLEDLNLTFTCNKIN